MTGLPKVTADGGWGSFFYVSSGEIAKTIWISLVSMMLPRTTIIPRRQLDWCPRRLSPCQKKERKGGKRKGTEGARGDDDPSDGTKER